MPRRRLAGNIRAAYQPDTLYGSRATTETANFDAIPETRGWIRSPERKMNEMSEPIFDPNQDRERQGQPTEPLREHMLSRAEEAKIEDARRRGLFKPPPMVATVMELLNF
jgi:hypothetical protein